MDEKEFISKYKKLNWQKDLLSLREAIKHKRDLIKTLLTTFFHLHEKYVSVLRYALQTPGWMPTESIRFHCEDYFLLHVLLADELFFLINGRKLRLNKDKTDHFPCGDYTEWFNNDYPKSDKKIVIGLSYCSLEGYDRKTKDLLGPIKADFKKVPKVNE